MATISVFKNFEKKDNVVFRAYLEVHINSGKYCATASKQFTKEEIQQVIDGNVTQKSIILSLANKAKATLLSMKNDPPPYTVDTDVPADEIPVP